MVVEYSYVPNLLQYALTGLEIADYQRVVNPAYRQECAGWFDKSEKAAFAVDFRSLSGVSSSTWFAMLYQIPAYIADDNLDSLLCVLQELSCRSPLSVARDLPRKIELIERYIPEDFFASYVGFEGKPPDPWPRLLKNYAGILEDFDDRFFSDRWESIRPGLDMVKDSVETRLGGFDWIGWWENRTGIEFVYPRFQIELVDVAATLGTSLLAERDGFFAHANCLKLVTMVSHEIGTHLLFSAEAVNNSTIGALIRNNLERYLRVVEVITWATNRQLIKELDLEWTMADAFGWIGAARNKIAALVEDQEFKDYWEVMESGFYLMKQ